MNRFLICILSCFIAFTACLNVKGEQKMTVMEGYTILINEHGLNTEDYAIVVDPGDQTLHLFKSGKTVKIYPVSTSKKGLGSREHSFRTPTGAHMIQNKIGDGAVPGTIFFARHNTGKISEIYTDRTDIENDPVTTRIMWLTGLEPGKNQGGRYDSHKRFIYIHGTPEEGLIGEPNSQGCVRMKNLDVIELFDTVPENTMVYILNNKYKK